MLLSLLFDEYRMEDRCMTCEDGSITERWTGATSCIKCAPGTVSQSPAVNCSVCEPGTISDIGDAECTLCDFGQAQPESGSSSCTNCASGRSTDGSRGAVSCSLCCKLHKK